MMNPSRHCTRQDYWRLPKRPLGPEWTESLLDMADQTRQVEPTPMRHYIAGWMQVEAGLGAVDHSVAWRQGVIEVAERDWRQAASLFDGSGNSRNGDILPFRVGVARALIPTFSEIPDGAPSRDVTTQYYYNLLTIAEMNQSGVRHGVGSQSYSYELLAMLGINRLMSRRVIAVPANPRGDDGTFYPKDTHDIRVLMIDQSGIADVSPIEVKGHVTEGNVRRYETGLVDGKRHLARRIGTTAILRLLREEVDGCIDKYGLEQLEALTDAVIAAHRHYQNKQYHPALRRHCDKHNCQIPLRRYPAVKAAG